MPKHYQTLPPSTGNPHPNTLMSSFHFELLFTIMKTEKDNLNKLKKGSLNAERKSAQTNSPMPNICKTLHQIFKCIYKWCGVSVVTIQINRRHSSPILMIIIKLSVLKWSIYRVSLLLSTTFSCAIHCIGNALRTDYRSCIIRE